MPSSCSQRALEPEIRPLAPITSNLRAYWPRDSSLFFFFFFSEATVFSARSRAAL